MGKKILSAFVSILILASCNQEKPVQTIENLKAGIKCETTSSVMYAAFAKKAKTEGHETISTLFNAVSKSEGIHSENLRRVLKGLGQKMDKFKPEIDVKNTEQNIQVAIDGETYETKTMYPMFFKAARTEKALSAVEVFTLEFDTELKHLAFFQKALAAIENKTENTLSLEYAICPVCGNIFEYAILDEKCSFCGIPKSRFIKN